MVLCRGVRVCGRACVCVCVLVLGGRTGGSMCVHYGPSSKLRAHSCELNPSSLELLDYLSRIVKRLRIRGPAQRILRSCGLPPPKASHVVRRDPSSPRSLVLRRSSPPSMDVFGPAKSVGRCCASYLFILEISVPHGTDIFLKTRCA